MDGIPSKILKNNKGIYFDHFLHNLPTTCNISQLNPKLSQDNIEYYVKIVTDIVTYLIYRKNELENSTNKQEPLLSCIFLPRAEEPNPFIHSLTLHFHVDSSSFKTHTKNKLKRVIIRNVPRIWIISLSPNV